MERPIFHIRWEREALYRRKPKQTKQKNKNKHAHTHTHTQIQICTSVRKNTALTSVTVHRESTPIHGLGQRLPSLVDAS